MNHAEYSHRVRVLSVAGYSYDAAVLDEWPLASYTRGALNAAGGLIIGHTSKDGTSPFYASSPIANATADEWAAAMSRRWGAAAPRVTARDSLERFAPHASNAPPAVTSSYVQADADERVACPLRTMATLAARHVPVFTFVFSQLSTACDAGFELKVLPWWTPRTKLVGSGWASHGAENHFLFGTSHGADSLADPRLRAARTRGGASPWPARMPRARPSCRRTCRGRRSTTSSRRIARSGTCRQRRQASWSLLGLAHNRRCLGPV
jgi:hypothetical protein